MSMNHSIYFAQDENGFIKIGTAGSVKERLHNLKYERKSTIILLGILPGHFEKEKELHMLFEKHHVEGEWFTPAQEILDFIQSNTEKELPEPIWQIDKRRTQQVFIHRKEDGEDVYKAIAEFMGISIDDIKSLSFKVTLNKDI